MIFSAWTTAMSKLGENPRGNNSYGQTNELSFRYLMGQQIKPPQCCAFWLQRRYAGRVAALQQLAEPAASPRKTKTTQTLSLIYREQEVDMLYML